MGYDKLAGRYEAIWMGNSGTHLSFSTGRCSEGGRVFTMHATETDPLTGETAEVRDVIEVHGPDHHTFERHYVVPGGEDVPGFEIDYRRKG